MNLANLTQFLPMEELQLKSHSTSAAAESSSQENLILDSEGDIKASHRALKHFRGLDSEIVRQLEEFYAPDFALFSYSMEGFL